MNSKSRKPLAVISGGSSGIGLAFVESLHARGYQIITCGRELEKLQQIKTSRPDVEIYQCDVSDRSAVFAFYDVVCETHGEVDLLISNAGGSSRVNLLQDDLRGRDVSADIYNNLSGAIYFVSTFLPLVLAATAGRIIVVGSGFGLAPSVYAPIYSAAKAGLHSFSKGLRLQLAGSGVSVSEVLPPVVDTPSTAYKSGEKLDAADVVEATLVAAFKGQKDILLGKARALPWLLRIAPGLAENIVANS